MSLPLKDLRTGIPETTDLWLDIESAASGLDKATVARDVLGEWAKRKAHAFKVAYRKLQANGAQTDWLGDDDVGNARLSGGPPADAGMSRNRR